MGPGVQYRLMAGTGEQPMAPRNVPTEDAAAAERDAGAAAKTKPVQPPSAHRMQMVIPTKVLVDALIRALCAPEVVKLYTDSLADAVKERLRATQEWDTAEMTARIMERIERKDFAEEVAQQIIDSAVGFKNRVAKGEKGGNDEEGPE